SLSFQNQIQSNFLRGALVYSSLFGQTVDYAVTQKMSDNAKFFNRFGLEGNQKFEVRLRLNPTNFLTFHFADRSLIYGQLSRDLLRLAAGGNKQFAGSAARFKNSNLNLFRFQEYGLGFQ